MKNIIKTFLISIVLGGILLPYTALGAEDPLVTACKSKMNQATNADLCVQDHEQKTMIFTVLEESLDTPNTEPTTTGNSMVRSCFRYTEILKCTGKGFKTEKVVNQQLLKKCPKEIPDTGTDPNGQYFDCQEVTVLIVDPSQGGTGILQIYLGLIYRWAAGIVGVIAVMTIIISGIQISIAKGEGEPSVVGEAKERIVQAIAGIGLLFLASGLLYIINPTFFKAPDYSSQNPPVETVKLENESSNINEDPGAPVPGAT